MTLTKGLSQNSDRHRPRWGRELLSSLRTWVVCTSRAAAEARIREALAEAGVPEAADLLFRYMWDVGHGAARPLSIACVREPEIGDDERLLLDIIALHQHGRPIEAMILLRSILRSRSALAASDSAQRLAAILLKAGHCLTAPVLPAVQQSAFVGEAEKAAVFPPATVHSESPPQALPGAKLSSTWARAIAARPLG